MTVRIAVAGALGRMGRAVLRAAQDADGVEPVAGFDRPGWHDGDSEGVRLLTCDEALSAADAVVDFSAPEASVDLAAHAAERGGVRHRRGRRADVLQHENRVLIVAVGGLLERHQVGVRDRVARAVT